MPSPDPPPKIRLSRLRDIGWSIWDPMGLLGDGQAWDDDDCLPFADEYDGYLVHAAGQLRRGAADDTVVDYLVDIEANRMGLGRTRGAVARARQVVAALQADDELWTFPD